MAVLDKAYEIYGNRLLGYMRIVGTGAVRDLYLASVTKKALGALGIRHPSEALHELHQLVSTDGELDKDTRRAVRAIGQSHPYETLEELASWPDSNSVFRLVGGLVSRLSHRPKEEVDGWTPLLSKVIGHSNPAVRWRIVSLLQRLASRKPREALPLITKLSVDDSPRVRKSAVTAMQTLGAKLPQEALKLLKHLEQDPEESVRRHAADRIAETQRRLEEAKTRDVTDSA